MYNLSNKQTIFFCVLFKTLEKERLKMTKITAKKERLVALLREEPHKFNEYCRELSGVVIDLSGAILPRVKLVGIDLSLINFTGAIFTGATITRVNFYGAELFGAKFTGAKITDTTFVKANLRWADFCFAKIIGKIHPAKNTFRGANLFETDFFETKFE